MASNFQKTIEFKVKKADLTRAVEKLFKDLKKIDLTVDEINKGTKILNKELRQSTKEINKAERATRQWGKSIKRAVSDSNALSNALLKVFKHFTKIGTGGGGKFGLTKLIGEVGLLDAALRSVSGKGLPFFEQRLQSATRGLREFAIAHAAVLTGVGGGIIVFSRMAGAAYSMGKAARQAAVSFNELRNAASKGGFKALFPAGSILGGNKGRDQLKAAVAESRKLTKEAEKAAYKYKEVATGINKIREQLAKSKRIQDKLLAGSDRYLKIAKNTLKIERQLAKEEQKRANILSRLTRLDRARKALGGTKAIIKGAGEGVAGLIGTDQAIRKLSGLLGQQIGLYKAVTKGSGEFFKALQAINKAAGNAIVGLDRYGRQIYEIISSHQRLIQSFAGVTAGFAITAKFTPQIFAAGKAWRQLEYDIRRVGKAFADSGFRGVGQLFPAGSMIGKRARGGEAGDIAFDGRKAQKKLEQEQLKAWRSMGEHPGNIKAHIEGLTKVNKILGDNQKIQEGINAFTGRHVQAVIATRKAQTAVNHELLKAKATQLLFNADIWAAQKAWNGLLSTLQKAVGLIGKLSLGLVGKATGTNIGKAAGIIGASRGIEDLIQKVPLLSQALKDNIQTFAIWTRRVTEAVASVSIAYTGLSTALSAAKWVTGAVTGFINWEKQAAQSIWNVQRAFSRLDSRMASNLDKGKGLFSGLGNWLGGGDERKEQKRATLAGPTRAQRIDTELAKQRSLLEARNTSAKDYLSILSRILKLEELQTKEIAHRKRMQVKAGADPKKLYKEQFDAIEDATKQMEEIYKRQSKAAEARTDVETKKKIAAQDAIHNKEMATKKKLQDWETKHWNWKMAQAEKLRKKQLADQKALEGRRRARREGMSRMGENLMLGAGFPLLFGGGAGAVGGGVLGAGLQAATGSRGFGMQILFSALGQQLDAFAAKTAELGKAFNKLNPDVDSVIASLGETNTAYGKHLEMLKKIKGESAAMAEATKRLAVLIGDQGVNSLKKFGDDSTALANEWTKAMTLMQTGLAELINQVGLFTALTNALGRANRFKSARRAAEGGDVEMALLFAQRRGLQESYLRGEMKLPEYTKKLEAHDLDIDQAELRRQGKITAGQPPLLGKGADVMESLKLERENIQMKIDYGDKEAAIKQKINEIMEKNKDLNEDEVTAAVRAIAATEEKYEAVQRLNALYTEMGGVIRDGLVNAIESAVEGTKTLGEVASSVFRQIARMMLNYGITAGLGSIGIKTRASGGPVTGGKPYIVGEKGPELFTPSSSGKITPNSELGGNVSVNVAVDASGSSAQGDQPSAQELGRLIGAAVQSELVRQKRPGGVLY